MDNKYLTKVCALLKPPPDKTKTATAKKHLPKPKANKYSVKINKARKLKSRTGEGTHRQHKVR